MQIKQRLNNQVDKKTSYIVIILAVIVALVWGIGGTRKNKSVDTMPQENTQNTEQVSETKPNIAKKPVVSNNTNEPNMSYNEALKAYEGRRIQFDGSCAATPFHHTYKNGTNIMLDNRSNQSRSVYIGYNVTLPAYGFKIVTLKASSFPSTILVDCDIKQNVATIIVQQ